MAKFYAGIETIPTGPLQLDFVLSETRAQDIFVMLTETYAPTTRERVVPDPTPDDPERTKVELYQDARTLGECLTAEINAFIVSVEKRAIEHKRRRAADAAIAAVVDQPEL